MSYSAEIIDYKGMDPENADRLNTVLYNLVESIVVGASLLEPYMPVCNLFCITLYRNLY